MNTLLAVISGAGIVHIIIWLIVAGLIFWLLSWLIAYVGLPEPFAKVAKVILAVAAVILIINALMSMAGTPFIAW